MFVDRTPDDAHAVRLVLSGQRAVFGVLVERYGAVMQAVAYAQTGNHADAEDAVQNAFVKAFTSLNTLRDTRRLGPWLASITRNEAKQIQRRASIAAHALAKNGAHDIASGQDAEVNDMHEMLRRNVMALEENQREVLLMHYFAERCTAEIAEDLGISRDAVKKRLERARAALGERIAAEVGDLLGPRKSKQDRVKQVMASVAGLPAPWLPVPAGNGMTLTSILKGGLVMQATSKWAVGVGALLVLAGLVMVLRVTWTSPSADPVETSPAPVVQQNETAAMVTERLQSQAASQEPVVAGEGDPALCGRVYDKETKAGIAQVEVVAKRAGAPEDSEVEARTDKTGAYEFHELTQGDYEVRRGDTPAGWRSVTWNDKAVNVKIEKGKLTKDVDFPVEREAPYDGIVVDSKGNPVEGAMVLVGGGLDIYMSDKTQSDREGHFAFHGMTPTGGMFVIARKASQVSAATEFELPPAGLHNVVITLEDGAYITGKVVDTKGRVLSDMQVYSEPVEDSRVGAVDEAISNSAGEFTAGPFAAGGYRLILRPKDEMATIGQDEGELFEVTSGERIEGVVLTYDRELSIAGRVTDEGGNPIAGARVFAGSSGMLETNANGEYTLANIAPGEYLIQVTAPGYTQAMMHGVPAGDIHADFILMSSHYELAGHVVDAATNQPVRSFEAAWFHFDHTRWAEDNPVMSAATLFRWKPFENENGEFTLPVAWYINWTTKAVFIVRAHGYGMALHVVDLGAPAQQIQEFRLQPGGRLEGVVVNEAGQPVKDALVFFDVGLTGFTDRAAATTNADGVFSIESFPQAEQRLAFCHPAYAKALVTISGKSVPLAPLNVTLISGGSIQANIEGGEPGAIWQIFVFNEQRFNEVATIEAHSNAAFAINHVTPGEAIIQAVTRGTNFRTVSIEREVLIEPGAVVMADLIVPEGDAALRGVIEVGEQRPQTFRVTARYALEDSSTLTHMALGRNDGAYELDRLPEGSATVDVEATMQDGQVYTESRDIQLTPGGELEADFDFSR